jgi:hypothetical protein
MGSHSVRDAYSRADRLRLPALSGRNLPGGCQKYFVGLEILAANARPRESRRWLKSVRTRKPPMDCGRTLVVDADSTVLNSPVTMLRIAGYTADAAASRADAL